MTKMSDLTTDLVTEILCRIPITSLRTVRSACKTWNGLSKNRIFGKAEAGRNQCLGFIMMDYRVCSLRFNLQGIRDDKDFVDPSIKQVSVLDQVEISKVFHCNGLLLCVIKDNSRLLVRNPYLGETRSIQPRNNFHRLDRYALGYNNNDRNHKILRFLDDVDYNEVRQPYKLFEFEIYDFGSNSWKVLDVSPDWDIQFYQRGVSLKGNTYFFAHEKIISAGHVEIEELEDFLLCFDFTTERFGPRLALPFHSYAEETVTLSCLREDKLAVLHQKLQLIETMEIWITTKIEPDSVSWSMFLKLEMRPLTGFQFEDEAGSFFINEEKRVAVVFDLNKYKWSETETCRYQTAYIVGQDGYLKSVNIGEAPNLGTPDNFGFTPHIYCRPLVCSSYTPSLVQLQMNTLGKRKERD